MIALRNANKYIIENIYRQYNDKSRRGYMAISRRTDIQHDGHSQAFSRYKRTLLLLSINKPAGDMTQWAWPLVVIIVIPVIDDFVMYCTGQAQACGLMLSLIQMGTHSGADN